MVNLYSSAKSETGREGASSNEASHRVIILLTSQVLSNPSSARRSFAEDGIIRLADSIRRSGMLTPLLVRYRKLRDSSPMPCYEVVSGERRLRAARLIGLAELPCIVIGCDELRAAEIALCEQLLHESLNMFETAACVRRILDGTGSYPDAAVRLSSGRGYIDESLALLSLSAEERSVVLKGKLSRRQVLAALRLGDAESRADALSFFVAKGLSENAAEDYISRLLAARDREIPKKPPHRGKSVYLVKDIKLFLNTLERAKEIMRGAGFEIDCEQTEADGQTELKIKIPHERTAPVPPFAKDNTKSDGEQLVFELETD